MGDTVFVVVWLALAALITIIPGVIASRIADRKGRSKLGWLIFGTLTPLIGIATIALLPSLTASPSGPEGARNVICGSCGSAQNVSALYRSYTCSQCKRTNEIA